MFFEDESGDCSS